MLKHVWIYFFILNPHPRIYIFFYRFQERGRKSEGNINGTNIDELLLAHTLTRDRTHNLGMCLDRRLNRQHFGYRTMPQPTEPPGQGCGYSFKATTVYVKNCDVGKRLDILRIKMRMQLF